MFVLFFTLFACLSRHVILIIWVNFFYIFTYTYLLGNRRNAGDQSVLIGPRGGWRLFISLDRRKNNHDYDDDADKITESVCHLAVIFEEGAMHRR